MRNALGETRELVEGQWVLSIVRVDNAVQHVYLFLEGLDEEGAHCAFRADLNYAQTPTGRDKTTFAIRYGQVGDIEPYRRRSRPGVPREERLHYISYTIVDEQKQAFDRLMTDAPWATVQDGNFYVKAGNKTSLFGGSVGTSLDAVGSTSVKQASISSVHSASVESPLGSVQGSHTIFDAILRKGHNCSSWAIDVVRAIVPEHEPTALARYVATVPSKEIPSVPAPEAPRGGCFIL